ncbi:MAG: restriction endonuclease subunit S [Streptococcus suis]
MRKLGEVGTVAMCRRIFKEQTSEHGEIPFYKIGTFGGPPDAFIARELFEEFKDKYSYPNIGDILISASGSIGRAVEFLGEDEYFQDSNIVWLKHDGKINNIFLKQFYSIVKWSGIEGSTIKRLYNENILNTEIALPTLPEQEAIGTFFSTLDQHITLHQRKLDKLKSVKQAYLSEMFPAEGERVPKRRFPGFTDAWELHPLREIGKTYTGLSGKTKDDFGHGDGRFVTYMNVFSNPISLPEMVEEVEFDESQNTVRYGDVLFTTSSETPEEVGMSSVWLENTENTYLNSFCFGFRPVKKVNPYYLAYLLRSSGMRRKISFLAQGISRYNISKTKMMELEISIPNENEQSAIGTFFSTLDSQITLHQRKLEKLKNLKKALLNELFV